MDFSQWARRAVVTLAFGGVLTVALRGDPLWVIPVLLLLGILFVVPEICRERRQRVTASVVAVVICAALSALLVRSAPLGRHDQLTEAQRAAFVWELRQQKFNRETIRVGCPRLHEEACATASQFVDLFLRAGWPVEGNQLQRVEVGKPMRGVALFKHGEGIVDPRNPDSGLWVAQTQSLLTVSAAFKRLGVDARQSADVGMRQGVIGVYIGSAALN
jgi:hypothetical protein